MVISYRFRQKFLDMEGGASPWYILALIRSKRIEAVTADCVWCGLLLGPRSFVLYLLRVLTRQLSDILREGKLNSLRKNV